MKKVSMIKLLGLVTMLMLSYSGIQAQHKSDEAVSKFGVRAGAVVSNQHFNEGTLVQDPESKFGADLALLYTIPLGNGLIALQPELHWLQKGSTFRAINGTHITNTVNYLELPV